MACSSRDGWAVKTPEGRALRTGGEYNRFQLIHDPVGTALAPPQTSLRPLEAILDTDAEGEHAEDDCGKWPALTGQESIESHRSMPCCTRGSWCLVVADRGGWLVGVVASGGGAAVVVAENCGSVKLD
jgi:hypothetical protein